MNGYRWLLVLVPIAALAQRPVSFNRDIRPIMADTCFRCHGPDKSSRMANLRLDLREEALKPNRRGQAPIVAGDPDKSHIIQRIFASNATVMPPASAHKTLTEAQKQTIRRWVAEGATYEGHWAYQPVRRPSVPAMGAGSTLDNFIQERLKQEGLTASVEAPRHTLLRRVTLDLTGLPPTPAEVAAFEADKAPGAYERVVDRLLASPRFAEKQAMHWLDAVRYADTSGFHGDNPFPAWPYRDYVLKAFRDNKTFDEFTREQLAGDLLPNATTEQRVASAFNRLNRTSAEGGIQPKEYLAKYGADRVRTLANVWLGSTMGCAECHDHKFDPFAAKDFYAMKAFFADIKETGLVPDRGPNAWGTQLTLASESHKRRLSDLDQRIAALDEGLKGQPDWSESLITKKEPATIGWRVLMPESVTAKNGSATKVYRDEPVVYTAEIGGSIIAETKPGNGLVIVSGKNPDNETFTLSFRPGAGEWRALGVELVTDDSLPGARMGRGADRFVMTGVDADLRAANTITALRPVIAAANASFPSAEMPPMGAIDSDASTGWGMATYLDVRAPFLAMPLAETLHTAADATLEVRLRFDSKYRRAVAGRFRVYLMPGTASPIDARIIEREKLKAERGMIDASIPRVVVSESTEPSTTRVLARGNFMDDSGEVVEPAIPGVFGKLDTGGRRATRLDLANWLVSPSNPLTARVIVNRYWRQFFGTGLSRVLEDLGSQGEWPTHPELLDWLAAELMQPSMEGVRPWDLRHLIRTIVTSQTYRQSSQSNPKLDERDPGNRLLARQSRLRVDAEVVRDIALSVSGLLSDKWGGPSVRPYQPEGYLAALNYPKRDYAAGRGDELYRRSVYTVWQRTFLHPTLMTFDAPSREECTVNRSSSNTPLQALVMLNDPIFVEAARVFAARAMTAGSSFQAQLDSAFLTALGRKPLPTERKILSDLYRKNLARFRSAPKSASELLAVGEAPVDPKAAKPQLAAMTTVTRAILNLHETITRN